jgi:putative membrane protein
MDPPQQLEEMTMNKALIAGIAAGTLLLAAPLAVVAQAPSVPERSGVNATLGVAPSTQDFVTKAAISGMAEIESSKLAVAKGDAKDKAFAERMIKDHTEASNELKQLVTSGKVKVNLPTTMDSAHQSEVDRLKGLNGAEFKKAYDEMQVAAHKDAVSLFERYAKSGDNADLKAFAAKTLPKLQMHLKMAEDLRK